MGGARSEGINAASENGSEWKNVLSGPAGTAAATATGKTTAIRVHSGVADSTIGTIPVGTGKDQIQRTGPDLATDTGNAWGRARFSQPVH